MIETSEARTVIDDLFEEEALVLGGLVAVHEVEDEFVWRLMRSIDVIRGKVLRRIEGRKPMENDGGEAESPRLRPHPAIEEFLTRLRRS